METRVKTGRYMQNKITLLQNFADQYLKNCLFLFFANSRLSLKKNSPIFCAIGYELWSGGVRFTKTEAILTNAMVMIATRFLPGAWNLDNINKYYSYSIVNVSYSLLSLGNSACAIATFDLQRTTSLNNTKATIQSLWQRQFQRLDTTAALIGQ